MSEWERSLSVSLPDDEDGCLQRSCPNCGLLFAVNSADYHNARVVNLRCPRCLFVEPFDDYITANQVAFGQAHAYDALNQMAEEVLDKAIGDLFKGLRSSS